MWKDPEFMSTSRVLSKTFRGRSWGPGQVRQAQWCSLFCLRVCRSGRDRIIGVLNRSVVECRIEVYELSSRGFVGRKSVTVSECERAGQSVLCVRSKNTDEAF